MIAFNNVLINQGDTLTVKGQKLIYDGNNNLTLKWRCFIERQIHSSAITK